MDRSREELRQPEPRRDGKVDSGLDKSLSKKFQNFSLMPEHTETSVSSVPINSEDDDTPCNLNFPSDKSKFIIERRKFQRKVFGNSKAFPVKNKAESIIFNISSNKSKLSQKLDQAQIKSQIQDRVYAQREILERSPERKLTHIGLPPTEADCKKLLSNKL